MVICISYKECLVSHILQIWVLYYMIHYLHLLYLRLSALLTNTTADIRLGEDCCDETLNP